jgi:hypothetical protein
MLRPFKGELIEQNYHELMEIIKVFSDDFESERLIDKEVISALWGICHLARSWAVHPDGMLRRNNLVSKDQIETIDAWIEDISYAVMMLMDGAGEDEAFNPYNERIAEQDGFT